jgi:hypothetical protein
MPRTTSTPEPPPPADLDRWVAAGLIKPEQAEAIRAYERGEAPPARRISLVTEALGYVGAALALAGLVAALGQSWQDLGDQARFVLLALIAGAFFVAGLPLRRSTEPALARLSSVLWFISAGSAGWASFLGLDGLDVSDEAALMLTGLIGLVYSAALWWPRRRSLQLVAVFGYLVTAASAGVATAATDAPGAAYTVVLSAVAAIWLLLARSGRLAPADTALALGAILLLFAPALSVDDQEGMFVLAFAAAGGLMALSVAIEEATLLRLSTVGLFAYSTWAVVHFFGDTLRVPVALALAGGIVLVLALVAGRLQGSFSRRAR